MSSPISSPRFQQGPSIPIKKDSRFQRELFKKGFIAAFTGKEDTYTGKEEWPSSHPEYPKGYALWAGRTGVATRQQSGPQPG